MAPPSLFHETTPGNLLLNQSLWQVPARQPDQLDATVTGRATPSPQVLLRQHLEPDFAACTLVGPAIAREAPLASIAQNGRLRTRARTTTQFRIPTAGHLRSVLNRGILDVTHYASGPARSNQPNLIQIWARLL